MSREDRNEGVASLHRTVAQEQCYDAAALEIFGSIEKASEFTDGITFTLARDPMAGTTLVQGNRRALKTPHYAAWPSVVVCFDFDANSVRLIAIWKSDD